MTYNRFEKISLDNPVPCKEVEGTYTRFEDISEANPFPVMVVDLDAYTEFQVVSETNPEPIALDTGDTYSRFEQLSEANRLPVVLVEGQSFDRNQDVSMTNPWPVIDTTASEYTAPLDLVPGAVVAYGQRALSAAKRGTALYTLRRTSDDTEQSFLSDGTSGAAPVSDISSFIGGTFNQTGAVTQFLDTVVLVDATGVKAGQQITGTGMGAGTFVADISSAPTIQLNQPATATSGSATLTFHQSGLYSVYKDQSNGYDLLQAAAVLQPFWAVVAANSLPGVGGRASAVLETAHTSVSWSNSEPLTLFIVGYVDSTDTHDNGGALYVSDDSGNQYFVFTNTPSSQYEAWNDAGSNSQEYDSASGTSGLHIFEVVISAAGSCVILVDGLDQNAVASEAPLALADLLGYAQVRWPDAAQLSCLTFWQEHLLWGLEISAPNRLAIRQNIATYYSITLP